MRFRITFVTTVLVLLPVVSKPTTISISGIHDFTATDLIVLDTLSSHRDLGFGLGLMRGDQIAFAVRYANLNALNISLGDSVHTGGFSILDGENALLEIDSIVTSAFAETSCTVNSQTDSLVIRLFQMESSDPLIFYRPCLIITDDITPGAITDLNVIERSPHSLTLSWSAPGDDSAAGTAALYQMKYSILPIESDTNQWWNEANSVTDLPDPSLAGTTQSVAVSGLEIVTIYNFILVSYDELGNRSGYSVVATDTTLPRTMENYCLSFGGAQFAEVPFDSNLNVSSQLTMEAWFYLDADAGLDHASIIDKAPPDHSMPFYQYNMGPANRTDFYAQVAIDGRYNPFEEYGVVQTSSWTHAAVTFDSENRTLYLNGQLISSYHDPGQLDSFDTGLRIGALKNLLSWFFDGYIDEVRIWNVARTQDEILQTMTHSLEGTEPGLVAYWDFNDGDGQVIYDRTQNHINGYLGNSPDWDEFDPQRVISTVPIDSVLDVIPGDNQPLIPKTPFAGLNFPNPFNGETRITFGLPKDSYVRLEIYDMLGRNVKTLISSPMIRGSHDITWNGLSDSGESLSSGLYFYRLKTPDFEQTRKMMILK